MGTYYDVEKTEKFGKPVFDTPKASSNTMGRLVAVCDRGLFKLAVDVTDPRQYQEFYQQYATGLLLSFVLYRIDDPSKIKQ